jgi:hypothetical protein
MVRKMSGYDLSDSKITTPVLWLACGFGSSILLPRNFHRVSRAEGPKRS